MDCFVPELHDAICQVNDIHKQKMQQTIDKLNDICKKYGLEETKLTWKSDHSEIIRECERILLSEKEN